MGSLLHLPLDFEKRVVEDAKRALDDIPQCREADYFVRWFLDGITLRSIPHLIVAFKLKEIPEVLARAGIVECSPAVAIRLCRAPSDTIFEPGEDIQGAITRGVHRYLRACGIRVIVPYPDGTADLHVA